MTSYPPSQARPTPGYTRARLAVFYPETGSTASQTSDIEALRRLESVIVENALLLFLDDSDYRWEFSEETGGGPIHAILIQTRHNVEIRSTRWNFFVAARLRNSTKFSETFSVSCCTQTRRTGF